MATAGQRLTVGLVRLGYVPALDGVRALAITGVVMGHTLGFPIAGGLGVDLFFALSGFLITTLLLEERAATGAISLRAFYRRRALRLLPALLVMLGVVAAVALLRGETSWYGAAAVVSGVAYFSNVMLTVDEPGFPNSLSHLWSLAQEEQFYIVWPLVLGVLIRYRATAVVVATIVGATVYQAVLYSTSDWQRAYYDPLAHSTPILAGCLLALFVARGFRPGTTVWARVGGPVLLLALMLPYGAAGVVPAVLLLVSLASIGIIVESLNSDSPLARVLSLPPLVFLGRISYSLYLWHVPVMVSFGLYHEKALKPGLLAISVSLALATLSYHLVEQPFLRRKRASERIPRVRRHEADVAPAAATSGA